MRLLRSIFANVLFISIVSSPLIALAEPVVKYNIVGTEASEQLGGSLACIPPFTSTSQTSELLIGRPGGSTDGRATLLSGADGTTVLFDAFGVGPSGQYGFSVSAVGDINGDSLSDLAVGDPGTDDAEIVFSPDGANKRPLTNSIAENGSAFGHVVAGLFSDSNNDGTGDVIVTAPLHDASVVSNAGLVSVISGLSGISIFDLEGAEANGALGIAASSINDYNSDSERDILVSAPGANNNIGAVYVYTSIEGAEEINIPGSAGIGADFGSAIAALPDVNQDSRDDILVGAPKSQVGGVDAGMVVLYNGVNGNVLCRINGSVGSQFGRSLAAVGDQNGDGIEDFAIGSPTFNNNVGKIDIYTYSTITGLCTSLFTINGTVADGHFGNTLTGKSGGLLQCDIDSDGRSDFGVGTLDPSLNIDGGSAMFFVQITPTPTPTSTPTATPTPGRSPSTATLWYRIGTDGDLTTKIDLNRDPGPACVVSLFGRRTTSDRRNRGSILTLIDKKLAEKTTRFSVTDLRKARSDGSGRPYIFHMIAKLECSGESAIFSNVYSRKLNCGKKPALSVRDWETQLASALKTSTLKKKSTKKSRKR